MTIIEDLKKIGKNADKVFLKYSNYSYVLIGVFIIINYLPKILGLSSTILVGSIGKLFGKSSRVGPSTTSRIAEEVEKLAKQLDKDTPAKIVKDVESAIKITRQLTEETTPKIIKEVVQLLDDIEIDLEESEDLQPQPKQGRPSEAWKRVKKMVKDKKFKELIEDDEKMIELPETPKIPEKKGFWEDLLDETDWADAELKEKEQPKKKSLYEDLFDETDWANEELQKGKGKQKGGAKSYLEQRQYTMLLIGLIVVHYLDYSNDCKNYETSDLFSSGLYTIISCIIIFILITKIGLYSALHRVLKRRNMGIIADLIDGGLVFFIYNIIKNIRDMNEYNKCGTTTSTSSNNITIIQNITSLEDDIKALEDKITEEKTSREAYQSELETKIAERTAIIDELNDDLQSQITNIDSNYANITDKQEEDIEALNTRITELETKISELITSQAELQTLLEIRISELEALTTRVTALESTDAGFEARIGALEILDHHSHEEEVAEEVAVIENEDDNVTICHEGQTLTVGSSAVDAHINHGDTMGEC